MAPTWLGSRSSGLCDVETVTRVRDVLDGADGYGNPTYVAVESVVQGAVFAPEAASSEVDEVGRSTVVSKPTLYFPGSWPAFDARDRVRVRGVEYLIDGDPADWRSPWSAEQGGLVVTLKRAAG